jgi:hypothetical protein
VNTGTIPSKTLRETVLNLSGWRERGFYGRDHRNKDEITAEDLRRRLHITLDHEVEMLERQFAEQGDLGFRQRAVPWAERGGGRRRSRRRAPLPCRADLRSQPSRKTVAGLVRAALLAAIAPATRPTEASTMKAASNVAVSCG